MGQNLAKNANIWPKMPNLAVFGPKIQILLGISKSFGTLVKENYIATLFALFLDRAWDQMEQKGQYLAKNASSWPNLPVFFFFGGNSPEDTGLEDYLPPLILSPNLGRLLIHRIGTSLSCKSWLKKTFHRI